MALIIDKGRTVFLAMHFQNDIVHGNGKMAMFGHAAHVESTDCLAHTRKALDASRKAGVFTVHIAAMYREGYPEFSGAIGTPPQMLNMVRQMGAIIEGTWGAEIHEEVKPEKDELIVTTRSMNAFYGTELHLLLSLRGITTLVLSGVATNFVVESTARYAVDAGYEVVVIRDCCASATEELHNFTLDNILPYLTTVSNSEEYVMALK